MLTSVGEMISKFLTNDTLFLELFLDLNAPYEMFRFLLFLFLKVMCSSELAFDVFDTFYWPKILALY